MNEHQIAQFVAGHEARLTVAEIAARYQSGQGTVVKYLRLNGFDVGAASKYTPEQVREFAGLYLDEGKTQAQIGAAFSIGADTVMRALAAQGITARDRGRNIPRRTAPMPDA